MKEHSYALDPLLAMGPEVPRLNFRPAVRPQRLLLLDGPTLELFDIGKDIYVPWQNGVPVSLPFTSAPFVADELEFVMVQVERDIKTTNEDVVLVSWRVGEDLSIEVVETAAGELVVARNSGVGRSDLVAGPIGESPAIVTMFELGPNQGEVTLTARNAETMTGISLTVETGDTGDVDAAVTIGGPTTDLVGSIGHRRAALVHLDTRRRDDHQLARASSGLRRVAGRVRDRL